MNPYLKKLAQRLESPTVRSFPSIKNSPESPIAYKDPDFPIVLQGENLSTVHKMQLMK